MSGPEDDINHKTVFVLDHCRGMKESSGCMLEIDIGSKGSAPAFNPPPVSKSLWSCVAESTLEYVRIVWDIFGDERLVRVITSNSQKPIQCNDWTKAQQSMGFLQEAFAATGPPLTSSGSIAVGIVSAIKTLSEPSPRQLKRMNASSGGSNGKLTNKGRIVCITSCTTEFDVDSVVVANMAKNNAAAQSSERKLPIDELEFLMISIHPKGRENEAKVLTTSYRQLSPQLRYGCRVTSCDGFRETIQNICVEHHDLVITTVTGIPMKEEAAASTSVNYDVPLYHPRLSPRNEPQTLKWAGPSPPKNAVSHLCQSVVRTTPVDVLSRPTTCLCNFVLSGRSVWLESQKKDKSTCNVLQCHGGELWIHVMESSRNVWEDPPSISEGSGGRVTDYRIPDFVEFMKRSQLIPVNNLEASGVDKLRRLSLEQDSKSKPMKPLETSKKRLFAQTAYWPLTTSSSILFGLAAMDTLLKLFPRDNLDEIQRVDCNKCIWAVMAIEARGDAPPISGYQLKKGCKKDEQWRIVYSEIETFLRSNIHSNVHQEVLNCFLDSRTKDPKSDSHKSKTDRSKRNSNATYQPLEKRSRSDSGAGQAGMNLLALWKLKTEKKNVRLIPEGGKLYAQKDKDNLSTSTIPENAKATK